MGLWAGPGRLIARDPLAVETGSWNPETPNPSASNLRTKRVAGDAIGNVGSADTTFLRLIGLAFSLGTAQEAFAYGSCVLSGLASSEVPRT
jgi:hypothetical protein